MTATVSPPAQPISLRDRVETVRRSVRESGDAMSPTARVYTRTLMVLAALALWLVLFGLVLSGLVESHAQSDLYARFRTLLAGGVEGHTATVGGVIPRGEPVALLSSSAAGIDKVVAVEGTSSSELRDGPGHYPGSPLPGQAGVAVIFGRSTTFGAPFAGLTDLHAGDTVTATTGQGVFTYVVQDVRRPGDPLPEPIGAGKGGLVLVTSAGGGWRSGWAPSYTLYVDALLKGSPVDAPAQGSLPTSSDATMTHDTSGLYPMVLWLQLLLVATVGGVWLRSRSGATHAWLLALPVGLAALWGASQEAWLLLPNLL